MVLSVAAYMQHNWFAYTTNENMQRDKDSNKNTKRTSKLCTINKPTHDNNIFNKMSNQTNSNNLIFSYF